MFELILKSIYFMLPAYFANMAPVVVKRWFKFLAIPIDFNKKWKGEAIFGSHKTIRGFVFGILFALIVAYLQKALYANPFFSNLSFIDYSGWLGAGFLLGFGALFGDLVKSFFKRRVGIKPGARFIPWDQLDYIIGALVFVSFVYTPSLQVIAVILIISFVLHVAANHIAYYLKITKVKW